MTETATPLFTFDNTAKFKTAEELYRATRQELETAITHFRLKGNNELADFLQGFMAEFFGEKTLAIQPLLRKGHGLTDVSCPHGSRWVWWYDDWEKKGKWMNVVLCSNCDCGTPPSPFKNKAAMEAYLKKLRNSKLMR